MSKNSIKAAVIQMVSSNIVEENIALLSQLLEEAKKQEANCSIA